MFSIKIDLITSRCYYKAFILGEVIAERLQVRDITHQSVFVASILPFVPAREERQKGKHNALDILQFLRSDSLSSESALKGLPCSLKMKGMWPDSLKYCL